MIIRMARNRNQGVRTLENKEKPTGYWKMRIFAIVMTLVISGAVLSANPTDDESKVRKFAELLSKSIVDKDIDFIIEHIPGSIYKDEKHISRSVIIKDLENQGEYYDAIFGDKYKMMYGDCKDVASARFISLYQFLVRYQDDYIIDVGKLSEDDRSKEYLISYTLPVGVVIRNKQCQDVVRPIHVELVGNKLFFVELISGP